MDRRRRRAVRRAPVPFESLTGEQEEFLTPVLGLVLNLARSRDLAMTAEQHAAAARASELLSALPGLVVASGRHRACPIRDGWVTVAEVAGTTGIPARTVQRWCGAGRGPGGVPVAAHRVGETWMVWEDDIRKAAEHDNER